MKGKLLVSIVPDIYIYIWLYDGYMMVVMWLYDYMIICMPGFFISPAFWGFESFLILSPLPGVCFVHTLTDTTLSNDIRRMQ